MTFFKFLVSSILLITAYAIPSRIESRVAHRKSRPAQLIKESTDASNVAYSSNWAGVVLAGYPPGSYTCGNAILQTGVDISYQNGDVSFEPWYEWYPDYAIYLDISINAGDSIQLTVNADTTTTGLVTIDRLSTGQKVSQPVSSSYALCEQDAEWIVEDYEEGGSLVPICDFGNVQFTDAYATTANGMRIYPLTGTIFEIKQGGTVYTYVSAGSESVYISYQ